MKFCGLLIAVVFVGCPAVLTAQQATIRGVVTDASQAAVPDAKVTVTNVATHVTQTAITNEQEAYVVPFLTPGTYSAALESVKIKAQELEKAFTDRSYTDKPLFNHSNR